MHLPLDWSAYEVVLEHRGPHLPHLVPQELLGLQVVWCHLVVWFLLVLGQWFDANWHSGRFFGWKLFNYISAEAPLKFECLFAR